MSCVHCVNDSVVVDKYNEPLCDFHNRERYMIRECYDCRREFVDDDLEVVEIREDVKVRLCRWCNHKRKKGGYKHDSKERNGDKDSG